MFPAMCIHNHKRVPRLVFKHIQKGQEYCDLSTVKDPTLVIKLHDSKMIVSSGLAPILVGVAIVTMLNGVASSIRIDSVTGR